jgi:hypothetical protein
LCSPPLPALPLRKDDKDDDDDAVRPPLTCRSSAEAAAFEVAALVVA